MPSRDDAPAVAGAGRPAPALRGRVPRAAREALASLPAADAALEAAWHGLAFGELCLDELHERSPHGAGLYWLGFDAGTAAQLELVRQAQHDADRLYLHAHNPAERAHVIEARLQRALEAMPEGVTPHSAEYFAHALAGVFAAAEAA